MNNVCGWRFDLGHYRATLVAVYEFVLVSLHFYA
jgi:hypothetical protein